jgi:type I restriction enzyme S subunit
MSFEWEKVPIESLCIGIFDGPHATPKKTADGPIFLGISALNNGQLDLSTLEYLSEEDFKKWTKRVVPQAGDIVFSYETRLGQVAIIPAGLRCCLGRRMALMRVNPAKAIPDYLLYAYLSPEFQEVIRQRTIHGSTVDRIPLVEFGSFPISVPPLDVQKEVVGVLRALDDRIALLRETNATLEAIAQALFKSWFVDFDPVSAKMEGRVPEGMDEATAALFSDRFEESELGLVPRGWQVKPLADAFEINPKRSMKKGSIAPYLEMASLATSGHCVTPPTPREVGSGAKFRNGDTLLARITPCLENGKSAFVDFLADGQIGWGSTEFVVVRPKAPLPEYFGYLLCRHQVFRDYAINSMSGTSGRQRIQNDVLGRYLLALPDEAVATVFGEVIEPIQKSIAENHQTVQILVTLRDTLLPRLISGQLRLAAAQTPIESATV